MSKAKLIPNTTLLHFDPPPPADGETAPQMSLTTRERDLIHLLGLGMTDRQMGAALCISEWTVKTHVQNLREKLRVHTRAAIVAVSWELLRNLPTERADSSGTDAARSSRLDERP